MKIVATSDIHGNLPELPPCDVVCLCGDIVPLMVQKNPLASIAWLSGPFQNWALNLPCEKVIMIWGNHDFIGERLYKYGIRFDAMDINSIDRDWTLGYNGEGQHNLLFQNDVEGKIVILCDEQYEYNGKVFYGTSWCPSLSSWAFYKDSDGLKEKFAHISYETDVLLTHCPPKFGQQGVVLETNWNFGNNFGCQELQDAMEHVFKFKSVPTYILSGHIHSGNHNMEADTPKNFYYRNVSLLDEDYEVAYKPFEFEI